MEGGGCERLCQTHRALNSCPIQSLISFQVTVVSSSFWST